MHKLPQPGQPVRGSTSGRPLMAALDLLGRRWVLRIVWELRDGPLTFRALQQACGDLSPSTLNLRLRELRQTGVVHHDDAQGYRLTELGAALIPALRPLTEWAEQWRQQGITG